MEIKSETINEIQVVSISGRLDANTSREAENFFTKTIDSGNVKFVVNLAKLDYISSAGLRVLLYSAKRIGNKGFMKLCGLNENVKEVFKISGFDTLFKIFETQDEAL